MVGGGSVLRQCGVVCRCGVAFVSVPAVLGVPECEGVHVVVAVGFGEDGCGGYGEVFAVAFDDGAVGDGAIVVESVSVDEQQLGGDGQLPDGQVHGVDGCPQDVGAVYFVRRDGRHSPGYGVVLYLTAQQAALFFAQLFGVVERGVAVVFGQDYGCRIDGSCQASASGFVAAAFYQVGGVVGQ